MGELLTREETAEIFGVKPGTVDNWRRAGLIPSVKIGRTRRFDRVAIEDAVKKLNENE